MKLGDAPLDPVERERARLAAEAEYRELLVRQLALRRERLRRQQLRPLDYQTWLPAQVAYFRSVAKRKLLRAGNQGHGKTTAGAADVAWRAEGVHPFRVVPRPPTKQLVICGTEKLCGVYQEKFWALCPKDRLHPSTDFSTAKGALEGKYPRVVFQDEWGAPSSTIDFVTGGGDALSLASVTLHHVQFDEPPESERRYNEAQKRLLRTNGDLSLTMTPVNRPVGWLKKRTQKGQIEDLHFRLEPSHMVLDDGQRICLEDGTPCDQAWIDRIVAETSDHEVDVIVHGEWDFRSSASFLAQVWHPKRMITDKLPTAEVELVLGIDFGDRPGKQVVLLLAVVVGRDGSPDLVYVLDEYVAPQGRALAEDDARGILQMLGRHRLRWSELRAVKSDRPHNAKKATQKGADELAGALAKLLDLNSPDMLEPPIEVAKRGEGRGADSVRVRAGWLYRLMARGRFEVHPRCEALIEALPQYDPLAKESPAKDKVDALVYGLDEWIYLDVTAESAARLQFWG